MGSDLTHAIVEVDVDLVLFQIKLSFAHLVFRWQGRVQFVLACHFFNHAFGFTKMLVFEIQNHALIFLSGVRQKANASVDEMIISVFVVFESLLANLLFTVDNTILVTMVIVEQLTVLCVNLDELAQVEASLRTFMILDQFELIWESSS